MPAGVRAPYQDVCSGPGFALELWSTGGLRTWFATSGSIALLKCSIGHLSQACKQGPHGRREVFRIRYYPMFLIRCTGAQRLDAASKSSLPSPSNSCSRVRCLDSTGLLRRFRTIPTSALEFFITVMFWLPSHVGLANLEAVYKSETANPLNHLFYTRSRQNSHSIPVAS